MVWGRRSSQRKSSGIGDRAICGCVDYRKELYLFTLESILIYVLVVVYRFDGCTIIVMY